jgi:hypothetical protein
VVENALGTNPIPDQISFYFLLNMNKPGDTRLLVSNIQRQVATAEYIIRHRSNTVMVISEYLRTLSI